MGGQACVFYGAAEFSRDCDIVIVADDQNLLRLQAALDALEAVWLRESRTPEVLIAVAARHPERCSQLAPARPLLAEALAASQTALRLELAKEELRERQADEAYGRPLQRELDAASHAETMNTENS